MSPKRRRIVRWSAFSAAAAAAATIAAVLLAKPPGAESAGPLVGLSDVNARSAPPDAPRLLFTDVARAAGVVHVGFPGRRTRILPEDMGAGVAAVDLDGDDDLDLLFVGTGAAPDGDVARLYENRGGLRFRDVTDESGLRFSAVGMGVAAGDYDGDGDLDLYLTAFGRNALFRNDGELSFTDVTAAAGVAGGGFSAGAVFADFDGDEDLDLYVCRYVDFRGEDGKAEDDAERDGHVLPYTLNPSSYDPVPNLLYENQGDGTFRERAAAAGAANAAGRSLAAVAADLDGNGRLDLYVANDVSDNLFLSGDGKGGFTDLSYRTATADYRGAMGLAVGDATGDGELDVFLTHWLAQENALYENLTARTGTPLFTDVATPLGLGAPSLDVVGWGAVMADFDLDGRRDLAVANGSTFETREDAFRLKPEPFQLFWNAGGDRGFVDLAFRAGPALARRFVARGAAAGDLDRDGDPDLVAFLHGEPPLVLRNDVENPGRSLRVRADLPGPNRFGVGTFVRVTAGNRTTAAVVGAEPSYLSSAQPEILFGMGSAAAASVFVRFPDGATRSYEAVPPGTLVVEPAR